MFSFQDECDNRVNEKQDDVVSKPFRVPELIAKIQELVQIKRKDEAGSGLAA